MFTFQIWRVIGTGEIDILEKLYEKVPDLVERRSADGRGKAAHYLFTLEFSWCAFIVLLS